MYRFGGGSELLGGEEDNFWSVMEDNMRSVHLTFFTVSSSSQTLCAQHVHVFRPRSVAREPDQQRPRHGCTPQGPPSQGPVTRASAHTTWRCGSRLVPLPRMSLCSYIPLALLTFPLTRRRTERMILRKRLPSSSSQTTVSWPSPREPTRPLPRSPASSRVSSRAQTRTRAYRKKLTCCTRAAWTRSRRDQPRRRGRS